MDLFKHLPAWVARPLAHTRRHIDGGLALADAAADRLPALDFTAPSRHKLAVDAALRRRADLAALRARWAALAAGVATAYRAGDHARLAARLQANEALADASVLTRLALLAALAPCAR